MVRASRAGADSINWFRGEIAVVFDKNTPKRDCIRRADSVACRKRHQSIRGGVSRPYRRSITWSSP